MARTAYISGHLDLTVEEFLEHYHRAILEAVLAGDDFVVGDAKGADFMAQQMLKTVAINNKVHVFHMFETPRNNHGFPTVDGFSDDTQRDFEMTMQSEYDIAWVRPGREKSGTAKNIERRKIKERMIGRWDALTKAIFSDSPVRLVQAGAFAAADQYKERILNAMVGK